MPNRRNRRALPRPARPIANYADLTISDIEQLHTFYHDTLQALRAVAEAEHDAHSITVLTQLHAAAYDPATIATITTAEMIHAFDVLTELMRCAVLPSKCLGMITHAQAATVPAFANAPALVQHLSMAYLVAHIARLLAIDEAARAAEWEALLNLGLRAAYPPI